MGERRYDEDEARLIFGAAAEAEGRSGPPETAAREGLTLAELQGIGLEVGLEPDRIAKAAAALDRNEVALPRKRQLGLPVSVGHVVDLPRAPTDREWDLLVSALRETFGARGKVTESGGIREWTNGNLHAYVEPTPDGYRLRMGTLSGRGAALNTLSVVFGSLSVVLLVIRALSEGLGGDGDVLVFALVAAGAFLANLVTLPGWARTRERQMAEIAERAVALLSSPSDDPDA